MQQWSAAFHAADAAYPGDDIFPSDLCTQCVFSFIDEI
ncbi:hypothetical protein ECP02999175_4918 [Escherichia coli P0299917.5]|nr:hypothetical protein ECP02999175_4918 [Escherichia coli P0299917.5]